MIWVIILILLLLIFIVWYVDYRVSTVKECMTPLSNEALQDIASIYNNSGTLTVPNLLVTGTITSGNNNFSVDSSGNLSTAGSITGGGNGKIAGSFTTGGGNFQVGKDGAFTNGFLYVIGQDTTSLSGGYYNLSNNTMMLKCNPKHVATGNWTWGPNNGNDLWCSNCNQPSIGLQMT